MNNLSGGQEKGWKIIKKLMKKENVMFFIHHEQQQQRKESCGKGIITIHS